jgi:antitoxin MazE
MLATISKWGNSQGLRVPKELLEKLDLTVGDKVKVELVEKKIIIEPVKEIKRYNIKDLVKTLPKELKVTEEFSSKVGVEEW